MPRPHPGTKCLPSGYKLTLMGRPFNFTEITTPLRASLCARHSTRPQDFHSDSHVQGKGS